MILVNKGNFSVRTLEKAQNSTVAPKSTFYADFKVCLALSGEASWEIEDRTYTIHPGDIVFLSIGQKRHFTAFGENGFRLCVFTLSRNAFVNLHHFLFFLERAKQDNVLKNCALSGLLQEIYEEWKTPSVGRYELASAKLTEFFIKAERSENYSLRPATEANQQMLELLDYIDENVTNNINLRMVAAKAGMTESTFSRHFSAMNGISFQQYVLEKKLQQAFTLLRTTNKKMIDVALDSGFDSVSGFYAAFKKKTGTTPNKFCALQDWDL
jgi:AraC-like DNA-binding protein